MCLALTSLGKAPTAVEIDPVGKKRGEKVRKIVLVPVHGLVDVPGAQGHVVDVVVGLVVSRIVLRLASS